MKKFITILLMFVMLLTLSACGSSNSRTDVTAEAAVTILKGKMPSVTDVVVYNEETDPNEQLGRPGQYIGKADFYDNRIENVNDNAGTIEFFSTEADCSARYDYLCKLSSPEFGVFGVNQYIYKYDLAVFRVSFDLTPTQAEEYKMAMDSIMNEVSEQFN